MNSIFKHSKLDEMQEIKQLKIEHYAFWALFVGLTAAVFVQAGQQAPFAQYAWELILLGAVSVGSLIANLWCGLWDRTARPTAGTNALAALVAAGIAGGMNFHYLPGAALTAATTWALTFALLQAATAIYKKRRSTLDAAAEDNDDCENENHKEDPHE